MANTLSKSDLNLLIPFQVLMSERSVTRAADKLCITQPAMSQTLGRLRVMFGDPLFVRAGRRLTPTPKACDLAEALEPILDQLRLTVLSEPFCPAAAVADVKILAPDTIAVAMTPPLFNRMQQASPRVRLLIDGFSGSHLEMLANGDSDFSIYTDRDYGREFVSHPLINWTMGCWMRKGHPLAGPNPLSLGDIFEFPIVFLTLPEGGHMNEGDAVPRTQAFFRQHGLDSRASIYVSSLLVARNIVKESNAVLISVAYSEAASIADALIFKPIVEARTLSAPIALIQHRRTLTSALHSWVRGLIEDVWSKLGSQAAAAHARSAP